MKTVTIEIDEHSWYAHAEAGKMRWTYYGGTYIIRYSDDINDYQFGKYIDPHTKEYSSKDYFIMDMVNDAISKLTESYHIVLKNINNDFLTNCINKEIYKYWKYNNWRYKDGREAARYWIEFERLVTNYGHKVEVNEGISSDNEIEDIEERKKRLREQLKIKKK